MKSAWAVLLISTAMVATGSAALPSEAAIVLCILGGAISAARTIQQALKATPETAAQLRGTGDGRTSK